jgi:hypothetical protein
MDDTIRETLASINERAEETSEQRADRLRDERGRFAKSQAESDSTGSHKPGAEGSTPSPATQSAPAGDTGSTVQTDQGAAPPAADPLAQAPSSWNAEAKAAWQTLPPQVRQQALKREEDFHKGIEQYRQAATFGTGMYRAIQPYQDQLRDAGLTPADALHVLFQAEKVLRYGSMQQKREQIGRMIQQYGVSFDDDGPSATGVDPTQILNQVPQIVQSTLQRERENWEVDRARQEVESFAQSSDKFGLMNDWQQSPDGRQFSPFRELMRSAIQSGLATDLKGAYEVAARAHPKSYERLTAEQQEAREKERKEKEAQRVTQARQASSVNVPRRGVLPAVPPKGSMDDTIRAKFRELNGS